MSSRTGQEFHSERSKSAENQEANSRPLAVEEKTFKIPVNLSDPHPGPLAPRGSQPFSSPPVSVSENARRVLERRYLKKDEDGQVIENPREMYVRVARAIAAAEEKVTGGREPGEVAQEFYEALATLDFVPNSPTLMNAGKELGQLSACFVLPVGDSMESIFDAIKHTALIHKSGGGTGFSFSRVRPKNDTVLSTKGVSSGPVSFMTVFDAATETIKQGGTRRGANMGILRVDHPDILDFIEAKTKSDRLNNFNISVAVTDKFMEALARGEEYNLLNPRTGKAAGRLSAPEVYRRIMEKAWLNGEPGVIYIDRINQENPTPEIGEIESTNPCGEQPLLPYESCNLGSINLARMVTSNGVGIPEEVRDYSTAKSFASRRYRVDYAHLRRTVRTAVRFLDNVIEVNRYPLPEIAQMTRANRKVGLGVMGFADLLALLGIPYDSEPGLQAAEEVMGFVNSEAVKMSEELAAARGPFPNFPGSRWAKLGLPPRRNATVTTIAPTGTISIIAGCSSGIEPFYALVYTRNVMDNDKLPDINPVFQQIAREEGFYSDDLIQEVAREGNAQKVSKIPSAWRRVFVCAHDITPDWHMKMQAAFQRHTENAVSKTVNFPRSASREDVARVYLQAFELGCKGVTVYRDGSRENQVLTSGLGQAAPGPETKEQETKPLSAGEVAARGLTPRPRPEVINGNTRRMTTGCGNLYITINEDEHGLFEVFTTMGKAGGCAASQAEAISRLISLSLRAGVDTESIIRQLQSVRCPSPAWEKGGGMILSCADAIAKATARYLKDKEKEPPEMIATAPGAGTAETAPAPDPVPVEEPHLAAPETAREHAPASGKTDIRACPECGGQMESASGCFFCRACGFSKCE
ncbi:MAG: vitamin B12-dependent ribonucleotide reductase [bacterium]|nr:vitamin B12-dependent ribonucleotide reductase [bacterium]